MLKKYETHTTKTLKLKGTIPSGVKSGDTDKELMVVEPLIEHPEIKGLYRAVDPDTGWKGWVEYTPEETSTTPTPLENKQRQLSDLMDQIKQKQELVDLGILTATEANLSSLKTQAKTLYNEINK